MYLYNARITISSYAYSASVRERSADAHANTCTVHHVGKRMEDMMDVAFKIVQNWHVAAGMEELPNHVT